MKVGKKNAPIFGFWTPRAPGPMFRNSPAFRCRYCEKYPLFFSRKGKENRENRENPQLHRFATDSCELFKVTQHKRVLRLKVHLTKLFYFSSRKNSLVPPPPHPTQHPTPFFPLVRNTPSPTIQTPFPSLYKPRTFVLIASIGVLQLQGFLCCPK